MKIQINEAYRNQGLIEAEMAGRGETNERLERLWIVACVPLFVTAFAPILFLFWVGLRQPAPKQKVERANPVFSRYYDPPATDDDGSWIDDQGKRVVEGRAE